MITHKTCLLTTICVLWAITSFAQYVPAKKRSNEKIKKKVNKPRRPQKLFNKFYTVKLKKKRQLTIKKPVVFCDTLIMEDESIIKVSPELPSFTLYAHYVKIGKNCVISSRGKDGENATHNKMNGESGTNAIPINLYLNFNSLKNLTIDASGGNGGLGQVPGIYGSGANIKLIYYAPFAVSFRKPRRGKQRQATIFFKYKKGEMDTRTLNRLTSSSQDYRQRKVTNVMTVIDPHTGGYKTILDPGGTSANNISNKFNRHPNGNRDIRNPKALARIAENNRTKQKDGKFTFKRKQAPILASDVQSQ